MRTMSLACLLCGSACTEPLADAPTGPDRSDCPEPTAGPTEHGSSIDADEIWSAEDSPHLLPYDTSVYATLTLEPCATVLLGDGVMVSLYPEGRLEALGLPGQAVTVAPEDPSLPWASLRGVGGTVHLEHVQVQGGGEGAPAAIHVAGPGEVLHVAHVSVEGSESQGVALDEGAFSSSSEDLFVSGSQGHPVRLWAPALGSLPEGRYTGNAIDEILVPGDAVTDVIREDLTLRDPGVPYRVGDEQSAGELRVDGGELALEPGVQLLFKEGGLLHVMSGALVAEGTPNKPIVFGSAQEDPQPGDWLGLWFRGETDRSRIAHARVEHAGGASSTGSESCLLDQPINDAAIRIFEAPDDQFVVDTEIVASAAHGFDRGWRSELVVDFLSSNRFEDVALCQQTQPGDPDDSCPADPACPQ